MCNIYQNKAIQRLVRFIVSILAIAGMCMPVQADAAGTNFAIAPPTAVTSYKEIMPESYINEEIMMAALLATGTLDKAVIYRPMQYEEAGALHRAVNNILMCVQTGESVKPHGRISYHTDESGVKHVSMYTAEYEKEGLFGIESDPRVIAEIEKVKKLPTFMDKVLEIASWTAAQAEYDHDAADYVKQNGNLAPDSNAGRAIGCLNGKAVCQGYACLADYLYEQVGIEHVKVMCFFVYEGTSSSHMVNAVKDSTGEIYITDSTNFTKFKTKIFTPLEYAETVGEQFRYTVNIDDLFKVATTVKLMSMAQAEELSDTEQVA